MKAVLATAPGELEVADVPDPTADGGAVVEVARAGICGTDVKIYKGDIPVERPLIMGHEMVGTIVEAAPGGRLQPGTRVLIDPATFDGTCDLCRRDRAHLCRNGGLLGRDEDGVFSEYITADENRLLLIPEGISDDAASLLQVLGTVVHAQKSVRTFPDQVGVVVGLGVSGQLHLQMLKARGMARVVAITRSAWKLDLASKFGASAVATPDHAAATVAEMTDGRGADLVIESVGKLETLAQSIELAGQGAEVLVFGTLTGGSHPLPYYQLYHKELTLRNPRAARYRDYASGIELTASGALDLAPLVTHRLAIDQAEVAFGAVQDSGSLKVVFDLAEGSGS